LFKPKLVAQASPLPLLLPPTKAQPDVKVVEKRS
jgi:hypothetical protein